MNSPIPALSSLPAPAEKIIKHLENCSRPLLTSHVRLDGDALGAELGLAHILKLRGADPHIVNDSPIQSIYKFLPGCEEIATSPEAVRNNYDLVIALDIPNRERAKNVLARVAGAPTIVAIDHHLPAGSAGDVEWRDPQKSSTGEMIAELAIAAGWTISPDAATCLYTAMVTDTGRFTYPNASPHTLRMAAYLMELGADHVRIAEEVYQQVPADVTALRSEATRGIKLYAGGRVALMRITREMLQRLKVNPIETNEFADIPRSLAGVEVGVLLREMKDKVKVSLRSRRGINIEPVARQFNGGGHRQAAGCEIAGSLDEAEKALIKALSTCLPDIAEQEWD